MPRQRHYPESVLVTQYLRWLGYQYPKARKVAYTIPNEGKRSFVAATNINKGIPDFCLPIGNNGYHALYIEFKIKPNKPTEAQLDKIELLKKWGNQGLICYNLQEAMEATKEYLKGWQDGSNAVHQFDIGPRITGD